MDIIQKAKDVLTETDDLSTLSDMDNELSVYYAQLASELAEVKKNRAQEEVIIKYALLTESGKYTEKEIERRYFSSDSGKVYSYNSEMLKAIGKLISAVRFKRDILR